MARTSADYPGFPADLAVEFDAATARIDEIRAQMDALGAELTPLLDQRRVALDLYAETVDDPATLLALSRASTVARTKFIADVRALHPYLYEVNEYLFHDWDENGKPKGETIALLGPHVSLMHRSDRLPSPKQAAPLAKALVAFAARYNPTPVGLLPEWGMGDHTGMLHCDLLTEHDNAPVIWYTPDGSRAVYYADTTNGHTGWEVPIEGTLTEVLTHAIKDAAKPIDPYDW